MNVARVVRKEFLQLRRDPLMLRVLFLAPIFQLFALGFAANNDVTDVPLVLVDQDRSAESRAVLDRLLSSGSFELRGEVDDPDEVERWLLRGDAQLALVIPPGFGRAAAEADRPQLQIFVDGTDSGSAIVGMGYANLIVARESSELVQRQLARVGRLQAGSRPGQLVLEPRVWYNPDLKSRWFYLPVILALVLLLNTLILPSMGVVREKEIGTLEQILVTPLSPAQLILGKLLPFALIGLVNMAAVTTLIVTVFQVPLRGSFLLLVLYTLPFLATNLALGLLVSTLVRTQQQAMMTAIFLVMIPMIYLSGLIFPIENMPHSIQLATHLIPLRYYNVILRGIFLKGLGAGVLLPEALILCGFAAGFLALGALRFRKSLD